MENNIFLENKSLYSLLLSFTNPIIEICEYNIFHSKEIIISVEEDTQKLYLVFNQTQYFKGSLDRWKDCSLKLSFVEESRNSFLNVRTNRDTLIQLIKFKDLNNRFCIISSSLSIYKSIDIKEKEFVGQSCLSSIEEKLKKGKIILTRWKFTKVQIWNSNKREIIIRIEPSDTLRYLEKEDKRIIYLMCNNPSFYQGSFMWYMETHFHLEYNHKNNSYLIIDRSSGYFIKCKDVNFCEDLIV
ncbi:MULTISPECIES: hypothetical protein [unclassified Myroides]|uniref:hypothetical protein n=1 Tax=unclassified Myroides TaxID=2642485 RepID=UPI003D2F5477